MSYQPTLFRPWARVTPDARFASWFRHAPIGTPIYRSPAGQGNFSFNATTRDSTGTPIANCSVYLFLANGNVPVMRTISDSFGHFTFDNPGPGPFYIVAFSGSNPVGTTSNGAYPDPKPVNPTTFTTAFPLTENPISQTNQWKNGQADGLDWNNVRTNSLGAFGATTVSSFDDCIACLANTTFTQAQFAEGRVSRVGGYAPGVSHEIELLLHFQITAHGARGYEILWGATGECNVVRWNGAIGDFTAYNGSSGPNIGTAVDGDTLRAEIDLLGVIRVYKNGTLVNTAIADTTFTDGQPGIGFWPTTGSTPTSYGWKSYTAGSL